jgi:transcriptional regulator with XRE-family HTH domain
MRHRWTSDHKALRRIYDARIGERMSQRDFAKRVGISQSMVAQLLSGDRPLPIDLAHKLARELGCTIEDICPPMAAYIREEVIPVLGKALRRAAVVLLAFLLQQFASPDANAALSHNVFSGRLFLLNR